MTKELVLKKVEPAAVFKPFKDQIAEFKEINEKTVFDYADKKGNKEARSHIYKLRKVKAPIKTAYEKANAEALALSRNLGAYKNDLLEQVEEMINVHKEPLDRAEKEAAAIKEAEELKKRIDQAHEQALIDNEIWKREKVIRDKEKEMELRQAEIEMKEKAAREEKERIELEERLKKEAEEKAAKQAELDRIEAERKLEEEKNRLAREAEENEKRRQKQLQDEKDRILKEAEEKERQEREKREAEEAKKKAAEEAKAAEEKRLADIAEKKAANKRHRNHVNNQIVEFLSEWNIDQIDSFQIIEKINNGEIPQLVIKY